MSAESAGADDMSISPRSTTSTLCSLCARWPSNPAPAVPMLATACQLLRDETFVMPWLLKDSTVEVGSNLSWTGRPRWMKLETIAARISTSAVMGQGVIAC
jgi:hypothetical protein